MDVPPTFGARGVMCRPASARPASMEAEGNEEAKADFAVFPGTDGCGSAGVAEAISASPMANAASIGADSIASAIVLDTAEFMTDHVLIVGQFGSTVSTEHGWGLT